MKRALLILMLMVVTGCQTWTPLPLSQLVVHVKKRNTGGTPNLTDLHYLSEDTWLRVETRSPPLHLPIQIEGLYQAIQLADRNLTLVPAEDGKPPIQIPISDIYGVQVYEDDGRGIIAGGVCFTVFSLLVFLIVTGKIAVLPN